MGHTSQLKLNYGRGLHIENVNDRMKSWLLESSHPRVFKKIRTVALNKTAYALYSRRKNVNHAAVPT